MNKQEQRRKNQQKKSVWWGEDRLHCPFIVDMIVTVDTVSVCVFLWTLLDAVTEWKTPPDVGASPASQVTSSFVTWVVVCVWIQNMKCWKVPELEQPCLATLSSTEVSHAPWWRVEARAEKQHWWRETAEVESEEEKSEFTERLIEMCKKENKKSIRERNQNSKKDKNQDFKKESQITCNLTSDLVEISNMDNDLIPYKNKS